MLKIFPQLAAMPGVGRLGFNEALEQLLERPVDLMTDHRIENPFLRAAVNASRKTVYAEPPAEALV